MLVSTRKHVDRITLMITNCWQNWDVGKIFSQRRSNNSNVLEVVILILEPDIVSREVSSENYHVQVRMIGSYV